MTPVDETRDGTGLLSRVSIALRDLRARFIVSFNGFRLRLAQYYLHYFVHVDLKEKCPACGTRDKHKIKFVRRYGRLIHICAFCEAAWGTNPLLNYAQWKVDGLDDSDSQETEPARSSEGTVSGASREPIVIRGKG